MTSGRKGEELPVRLEVRLSKEDHKNLVRLAHRERRSISNYIRWLITQAKQEHLDDLKMGAAGFRRRST